MFITAKCRLLWNDQRIAEGETVELLDADAEHLIAEGVAEEFVDAPEEAPATSPAKPAKGAE